MRDSVGVSPRAGLLTECTGISLNAVLMTSNKNETTVCSVEVLSLSCWYLPKYIFLQSIRLNGLFVI